MIIPDIAMIRNGIDAFWPDPPAAAQMVLSWKDPQGFRSEWFRANAVPALIAAVAAKAPQIDTYVGMALRHPQCPRTGRGGSDDAYAIGSLWFEADHTGGVHTASTLPTPLQLNHFLRTLPFTPSLQIDSTGGVHVHLLLKELWILDTQEERTRAAELLQRLQHTVQLAAAARGWRIDTTSDLARVLRLPGTFNHKSGVPLPVTVIDEHAVRYNPSDIEDAPWLAPLDAAGMIVPRPGVYPAGDLQRILGRCGWLRHCMDDAAILSEPEWYAALGIIGRCADGEAHVHAWSQPYPRYRERDTTRKLAHALTAAGPRTCQNIRATLGGEPYCSVCPAWGKVKSPIVHSLDSGARLRVRAANWHTRTRKG